MYVQKRRHIATLNTIAIVDSGEPRSWGRSYVAPMQWYRVGSIVGKWRSTAFTRIFSDEATRNWRSGRLGIVTLIDRRKASAGIQLITNEVLFVVALLLMFEGSGSPGGSTKNAS